MEEVLDIKKRKYSYIDIYVLISIFAFSIVLIKSPFEIYLSYVPMVLLLPFFFLKYGLPKVILLIFLPLLLMGLVYVSIGENTFQQFFKIFLGLFMSVLFFNYVFRHYNYDMSHLFKIYVNICLVAVIIGFIQIISFRLGISPLYNYRWIFNKWAFTSGGLGIRVNSIFSEPSYYATTIAPAFFLSLYNLFSKEPLFISKRKSFIIAIGYFLSFSSLGVFAVFLSVFFILLRFGFLRLAILFLPTAIAGFYLVYSNVPEFRERFESTQSVFSGEEFDSYAVHGSSFVLFNNYQVAVKNFQENPLFGTGLGSHVKAFEKYSLTNNMLDIGLDGNSADANSMFLRIMSEMGLFGLVFIIIYLIKNFLSINNALDEKHWVMSVGCLIIILLYLIRQGHYFYNGFPFFLWMYYYLKKKSSGKLISANDQE